MQHIEMDSSSEELLKIILNEYDGNDDFVVHVRTTKLPRRFLISLNDCVIYLDEKIFVAAGALYQKEIEDTLLAMKIVNYELLDIQFLNMLEKKYI